jgi:hypothetical protein
VTTPLSPNAVYLLALSDNADLYIMVATAWVSGRQLSFVRVTEQARFETFTNS